MPYGYRKNGNKVEVYRKDTGKKVGETTPGKLKGYLAALHAHEPKADKGVEKEIKKARKRRG